MIKRKNKQPATHPWMVAGERVKRERLTRIARGILALRTGTKKERTPC